MLKEQIQKYKNDKEKNDNMEKSKKNSEIYHYDEEFIHEKWSRYP